jgi:hypothetical protein
MGEMRAEVAFLGAFDKSITRAPKTFFCSCVFTIRWLGWDSRKLDAQLGTGAPLPFCHSAILPSSHPPILPSSHPPILPSSHPPILFTHCGLYDDGARRSVRPERPALSRMSGGGYTPDAGVGTRSCVGFGDAPGCGVGMGFSI